MFDTYRMFAIYYFHYKCNCCINEIRFPELTIFGQSLLPWRKSVPTSSFSYGHWFSCAILSRSKTGNRVISCPSVLMTFFFFISVLGESIKCNYCNSRVSYEDCDKNMKHVECAEEFGLDKCAKTHIKASSVTEETFMRGCQSANGCKKPTCKESGDDRCEVYCCTGDNCNKSAMTMVSSTMLFTCSVLAFLVKLIAWTKQKKEDIIHYPIHSDFYIQFDFCIWLW